MKKLTGRIDPIAMTSGKYKVPPALALRREHRDWQSGRKEIGDGSETDPDLETIAPRPSSISLFFLTHLCKGYDNPDTKNMIKTQFFDCP